ncbi:MAG: hypothetical protein OXK79_05075 [Chloroflexota bacterium]|nr:hypothetical protein [Chloroflexota bacterium]
MAERSFEATQEHPKQTGSGEWRIVALGDVCTKLSRLAAQWREHQTEAQRLDAEIEQNFKRLRFD